MDKKVNKNICIYTYTYIYRHIHTYTGTKIPKIYYDTFTIKTHFLWVSESDCGQYLEDKWKKNYNL